MTDSCALYERVERCADIIRKKTDFVPRAAVVLGSGLGDYASSVNVCDQISYKEIDGFPVSTVAGHEGAFIFGYVKETPVVLMKGRVHYYEGYSMEDVILPVRVMKNIGAKTVILTNAAGGINCSYSPGDLMVIRDHIACFVPNPLSGGNAPQLGPRFPDMSSVYDKEVADRIAESARCLGIHIQEGVYAQLTGPSYETPAEIKMLRTMGADAVGMSTACEAIAAVHMGMKVGGISCVTNMAAGILDQPLDHKEVQETADQVKETFAALVTDVLGKL